MTNDRKARAERAEQMRKERERADRRQRNLISLGIVAVVILLVAVGGWAIKTASDANQSQTEVIEPKNLADGGIPFPATDGKDASSAPLVQTYEDFLCPACGQFEQLSGSFLQQQAAAGAIRLRFMPFSFLHQQSTNDYSRRATNLAMCAVDEGGPEAFWKVHNALYANQPEEGGAGPEDAELLDLASSAGVDVSESCVKTEHFVPWIDDVQAKWSKDPGVSGTPTVYLNGKVTEARTPDELQKAITEAAKS